MVPITTPTESDHEGSIPSEPWLPLTTDSWDTHVHIFDSAVGPYSPSRAYTPAQATLQQLLEFSSGLTQEQPLKIVLVQPSPYGSDNTVLLHSLKQLHEGGRRSARGIAVVDIGRTSDEELWSMHELGIRGLRINKQADGRSADLDALRQVIVETASRIKGLPNWKIQLFCAPSTWDGKAVGLTSKMNQVAETSLPDLHATISSLPVEVIADHVGGMRASSRLPSSLQVGTDGVVDPTKQPGFESMVKLAKASKLIIKLSGLYRLSKMKESGYDDLEPIITSLVKTVPDRLIWGSDWPHTGEGKDRLDRDLDKIEGFQDIDDRQLLRNLRRWVGDEEMWARIMVTNPQRFYE